MTIKFKLMPFPPTEEMLTAYHQALGKYGVENNLPFRKGAKHTSRKKARIRYQAMWDAAPQPPAEGGTPRTNALPKSIIDLDKFLNEPPEHESRLTVRE